MANSAPHSEPAYVVQYIANPVFVPFPEAKDTDSLDGSECSRSAEPLKYADTQNEPNDPPHWFLVRNPSGVTPAVLHYNYPGEGTPESPYAVDFLPDDKTNPLNFDSGKKWKITGIQGLACFAVATASTAYSGGVFQIIFHFQVSDMTAILGISLFVLGFAIGPMVWAPLSGMYSRRGEDGILRR